MQFSVQRDFASGQFVRCFATLPSKSYVVGGAGFTIKHAIAKCRSEYVERLYGIEKLAPYKIRPIGIAAHPSDPLQALRSAKLEMLESLMLDAIKHIGCVEGFRFINTKSFSLSIQHVKNMGFFASLKANYRGKPILFYSARSTLIATLLKVWEEWRNPYFHKTPVEAMPSFSKSTKLFSDEELGKIEFKNSTYSIDAPKIEHIEFFTDFYQNHHIAYAISRRSRK